MTRPPEVLAGGAALWRPAASSTGLELALVHRPRYDDWSLPKGKLDDGEHLVTCAAREVEEETGLTAELGRSLGEIRYPVTERDGTAATKVVRYWAARATGGAFAPNDEVDELAWLAPEEAVARLSHAHDRAVVERLLARPHDTGAVVLVRHARAGSRADWHADDRLRPLDARGVAQALGACTVLAAFGPRRVLSADLTRCVETVRPLAERLGVPVELEPALSEDAWADDPDRALARLADVVAAGDRVVLCSQGGVLPWLVRELADRDGVEVGPRVPSAKGSAWVLSTAAGRVVDAEYVDRLTPAG